MSSSGNRRRKRWESRERDPQAGGRRGDGGEHVVREAAGREAAGRRPPDAETTPRKSRVRKLKRRRSLGPLKNEEHANTTNIERASEDAKEADGRDASDDDNRKENPRRRFDARLGGCGGRNPANRGGAGWKKWQSSVRPPGRWKGAIQNTHPTPRTKRRGKSLAQHRRTSRLRMRTATRARQNRANGSTGDSKLPPRRRRSGRRGKTSRVARAPVPRGGGRSR